MGLTGLIYGGIVVGWLCYLVPLAVRRHDEASRARSIDRFSAAMRVLSQGDDSDRLVGHRTLRPAPSGSSTARPRRVPVAVARRAARVAARRRRRTLTLLLLVLLVVVGLATGGVLAWWTVGVPGGLVLCWLVVARLQVSRTRASAWEDALRSAALAAPDPVEPRGDEPDDAPTVEMAAVPAAAVTPGALVEQHVVAAPVPTADGRSLWDPLPVTLPTYVTKPRAERAVRTVDLSGDGVWSSGRLPVEEALVGVAGRAVADADETADEAPRRAVND